MLNISIRKKENSQVNNPSFYFTKPPKKKKELTQIKRRKEIVKKIGVGSDGKVGWSWAHLPPIDTLISTTTYRTANFSCMWCILLFFSLFSEMVVIHTRTHTRKHIYLNIYLTYTHIYMYTYIFKYMLYIYTYIKYIFYNIHIHICMCIYTYIFLFFIFF